MSPVALGLLALQWQTNPGSGVPLPPRWGWYVVLYFFIGGLTAGCYAIAAALELAGDPRDREAVRIGYGLAFPGVLVCAVLLIVDLGRPERFWHMIVKSHHFPEPILKYWSPISLGSWILSLFGAMAFVSFVGLLLESGRVRWTPLVRLGQRARQLPSWVQVAWLLLGCLVGLALAGYTGVLMISAVTPVWHNAIPLGGLFLASAVSTSYALLILVLLRRGHGPSDPTVRKLEEADRWAVWIELVLLLLVLALLGALARPILTGGYGALFWLGVVVGGLLAPVILDRIRGRGDLERRLRLRAILVLAGGLMLRFVLVMAPQWPQVAPWHL